MSYGGSSRHHQASSASSLSPLAPPFTAARGGSRTAALPYDPYASSWSPGQGYASSHLHPHPPQLSPPDGAPYFDRGGTSSNTAYSGNFAQVEPYYPRSGIQSLDRDFRDTPPGNHRVEIEADAAGGSSVWERGYGTDCQHFNGGDSDAPSVEMSGASFSRGISHLSPSAPLEEYDPYSPIIPHFGNNYNSIVDAMKSDAVNFCKAVPQSDAPVKPWESLRNPNFRCGDEYSATKTTGMFAKSAAVKISAPPVIEFKNQISQDQIEGISENQGFASSDAFDEHLGIDSPCWRGASSSRNDESTNGAFDYFPQASSDYMIAHNEGNSRVPCFPKEVGENRLSGKQSNEEAVAAPAAEVVNETGNLLSDPFSFLNLEKFMPSLLPANDKSDEMVSRRVSSEPLSKMNLSLQIDSQLLVQAIHNLSGVLVTTCCFNANALKDQDRELLQSVMSNLQKCISFKTEDTVRPEPSSCSVSYSHEHVAYSKEPPKTFPSFPIQGVDSRLHGEIHSSTYKSEKIAEGTKEDLWFGIDDAVNQLKLKLDALKSELPSAEGWKPPKILGRDPEKHIAVEISREKRVKSPFDVDPAVMDRFRVLKGRMERLNGPCGRVDSRLDCESVLQSGPSNFPLAPGRRFGELQCGSSDWEHVLKEELT